MIKLTIILLLVSFIFKKNALLILLTLEIVCFVILLLVLLLGLEIFFGLLIICVGACEGAVGLGSLVGLSRLRGGLSVC